LGYYANQCLNPSENVMTTRTLPTASRPSTRSAPSLTDRIGDHLRALVAAFAAWRRKRALEDQAIRASRELAGLSSHVLRDIGACDAGSARAGAVEYPRRSALDLEIRG
jgi:uncharacterized protein YjiS (DUF1127 family)